MRILAIADEESKYLWDYFQKEKLEGIDLILSSRRSEPQLSVFSRHLYHSTGFICKGKPR